MTVANPELQRNIWIELTGRRLVIVPVILLVLLSPWLLLARDKLAIADPARWLYYALVIVWGTRLTANSVIGEIRARTWDLQRLSSLSPWAMLWGKLFGAPILVWYAGGLCLIPIVLRTALQQGPAAAGIDLAYYLSVGLFAHSVSLLTSLISVRKRARQSWLDTFLFQVCGIIAGFAAAAIWMAARHTGFVKTVDWYGVIYDSPRFTLASLIVFLIWSIVGNWRLMRAELQMRGGPLVWLAFLVFMMAYYAGFADAVSEPQWRHAIRLAAAASVAGALTYIMMFLEPKSAVHVRWLIDQLARLRLDRFFAGLQSWMFAYGATVIVALWLVATLQVPSPGALLHEFHWLFVPGWTNGLDDTALMPWRALVVAALLFMSRDMALFFAFNFAPRPRRADFLAILWLVILYAVAPSLLAGLGLKAILPVFMAVPAHPPWLGPVFPAIEAAAVSYVALRRLFALDRTGARDMK